MWAKAALGTAAARPWVSSAVIGPTGRAGAPPRPPPMAPSAGPAHGSREIPCQAVLIPATAVEETAGGASSYCRTGRGGGGGALPLGPAVKPPPTAVAASVQKACQRLARS